MSLPITEMTDAELLRFRSRFQAEIDARANALLEKKSRQAEELAIKVLPMLPTLVHFMQHSRTTCTETGHENAWFNSAGYPKCNKCFVNAAIDSGVWDMAMQLQVTLTPTQ